MLYHMMKFKVAARIGSTRHLVVPAAFPAAEIIPSENSHTHIISDVAVVRRELAERFQHINADG